MVKIADCGGYELFEDGPRLLFVQRATGAYSVGLFVLGLLVFILGVNGVLQIAIASSGGSAVAGVILLVLAVGAGAVIPLVLKAKRAQEAQPIDACVTLVVDRAQGVVADRAGRALAPLQGVIFRSAFQVGSSSRALEICYAGQAHVIARGSPFSGSIEGMSAALQQRGFRVS
jgi:hypothetical protein